MARMAVQAALAFALAGAILLSWTFGAATPGLVGIAADRAMAAAQAGSDTPYVWTAERDDRRIRLEGSVPSEDDRMTVLGMVKANMPDLEISDRMEVQDGAPDRQTWLGAVSFALVQLKQLAEGHAALTDTRLSLEGETRSAEAYLSLHAALESLPSGVELGAVSVVAPEASPFTWTAKFEDGTLTLSGHVIDDKARAGFLRRAAQLVPDAEIVDRMELASGAPHAWRAAASAALAQLVRLEAGTATLSDTALTIEGMARDEELATEVAQTLETGLPTPFETSADVRFRVVEPPPDPMPRGRSAAPGASSPA